MVLANLWPFLGKVIEQVMVDQLQTDLEETDYLDPYQSGCRLSFGIKTVLITLLDDLYWEAGQGKCIPVGSYSSISRHPEALPGHAYSISGSSIGDVACKCIMRSKSKAMAK